MINSKLKSNILIVLILVLATFLRFDRIGSLMGFIGDQGWFYLSARNMLLTGSIPLVGITSSHTWLHQGPLWTYMLSVALFLSKFNPVSGAILTAGIGIVTVYFIYRFGKEFFSKEFGLIAAFLYASSPLIVLHARFAYHTSPIPLFVLLFLYAICRFIKGNSFYFPVSLFILSLLYNFELATVVFIPILIFVLFYGFYNKEKWYKNLLNSRIIILSMIMFVVPMIPILIYDSGHGYPQTIKYMGWFVYKVLQVIHIVVPREEHHESLSVLSQFFFDKYQLFAFIQSLPLSICLFFVSICVVTYRVARSIAKPIGLIFLCTVIPLLGFFIAGARSEAYLPMLFPGLSLCLSYLFYLIYIKKKTLGLILILFVGLSNAYFLYTNNYFMQQKNGYGLKFTTRLRITNEILHIANGQKYNLIFVGPGSEFVSSTMNYEYLTWWLGKNPPAAKKTDTKIYLRENGEKSAISVK